MGAIAVAGATGAGAGGILAATGLKGASAFGALMKAGFVGFTGAAGATAGLIGSGGSLGLSGSILAGGSAITPVAPTAISSAALSTAPMTISSLPAAAPTTFSSTLGAGATTGGGTFIGGLGGATSTGGMSLASTASTAAGTFTTTTPVLMSAPATGTFTANTPLSATVSSFTPATGTFTVPTTSTSTAASASFSTTPGTSITSSPVRIAKSRATSKKYGFLNDLKEGLKGGVIDGARSLVGNSLYNLVMHGDIKGEKFEQDLTATGGGQASSYMGSYALPSAIDYEASGIGGDTIGNTYVSMLQNLNYGTGSLDYARHTNMALMRGIQIPQIQYA